MIVEPWGVVGTTVSFVTFLEVLLESCGQGVYVLQVSRSFTHEGEWT